MDVKKLKNLILLAVVLSSFSCGKSKEKLIEKTPFDWNAANVYFLLTDRFFNGDPANDVNFDRNVKADVLRGFEGGDLKGITQKIKEGYFDKLGINAIWMTPIVEQIHGYVDEGTGVTYGFHGYWAKDWTVIDPNFGTKADLHELVATAHAHGIRILLDAVINHTGPETTKDPAWEDGWVRTGPPCAYKDYASTVTCTLVENLPDIKTESNVPVDLPNELVEKWKLEGRYEQEVKELDAFFERTGYPRAPRFYIMKWLADYIVEFGIDGYRVDTVKHTEAYVWKEFKEVCEAAFETWKKENPSKVLDDNPFFTVAEVYNFNISSATAFDYGDKKVNYYDYGFNSVINFEFKYNASQSYENLFRSYDSILNTNLKGNSVMNYFSSHDDGQPFDAMREKSKESAVKLLLTPGISQVYYGDESGRKLVVENAIGDANLRSFMNWDRLANDPQLTEDFAFWGVLGRFRKNHPAVGAGRHNILQEDPYFFSRTYQNGNFHDKVVVGLDLPTGECHVNVSTVYEDGIVLVDYMSGKEVLVMNGTVSFETANNIVLLGLKK